MGEVEYVGPHDEVEVDGFGVVARGKAVEVPPELAGHPPHGHRADEDYDPGSGLLAQVDNWRRPRRKVAGAKPAKKAASSRQAKPKPEPVQTELPDDASAAAATEGE